MRTGRPRSFDRDAALERAMVLFWKHGYDATSVASLTAAMGIGAPSMYAAFGDKRALFDEVVDRYLRTYGSFTTRALQEGPLAYEAIARLLREAAIAYAGPDHPPGCLLSTAATNCSPQSSEIEAALRELRAAGTRALEEKIQAGIDGQELPSQTDAGALAIFIAATLRGMSAQARDGASREELEKVAAIAVSAIPRASNAQTDKRPAN